MTDKERALEAYPKDIEKYVDVNGVKSVVDNNSWQRAIFLQGYQQAEKDLALTLEDIKDIVVLFNVVITEKTYCWDCFWEACKETLKRYNKLKEK